MGTGLNFRKPRTAGIRFPLAEILACPHFLRHRNSEQDYSVRYTTS
jgi:hypothetical protein